MSNSPVISTTSHAPMYVALAAQVRELIRHREYQPGQLIGSEHELARREGVSRVTVRKASELLVNEGVIERRPGKGLFVRTALPAAELVQIVVGNLSWEPCLKISRGAGDAAKHARIPVQLYDAHGQEDLDLEMIRNLPNSPARGAVIVSFYSKPLNHELYGLVSKGFPFVLAQQRLRDIEVPSVVPDDFSGGYQAGQALVELGHRRIGFIGDLFADSVQGRLTGLRDALGDAGLPFDRSLVVDLLQDTDRLGDWTARTVECVREVMSRPNPPTALFCSCDAIARAAYRSLAQMGAKVPDDVSVIGFDDDSLAEWISPGLTTVRQPFEEMGRVAMELLYLQMSDPTTKPTHRVLPVELVRRGSIAAPKKMG